MKATTHGEVARREVVRVRRQRRVHQQRACGDAQRRQGPTNSWMAGTAAIHLRWLKIFKCSSPRAAAATCRQVAHQLQDMIQAIEYTHRWRVGAEAAAVHDRRACHHVITRSLTCRWSRAAVSGSGSGPPPVDASRARSRCSAAAASPGSCSTSARQRPMAGPSRPRPSSPTLNSSGSRGRQDINACECAPHVREKAQSAGGL